MSRRVVVTGMGAISPIGNDVPTMWKNMVDGVCGIETITAFDTSDLKVHIAGTVKDFDPTQYIEKKEVRKLDPYTQYAIAAAQQAVDDSGIIGKIDENRFGVYIGAGIGGLQTFVKNTVGMENGGSRKVSPFFIPMMIGNIATGNVAIRFNAKGASLSVMSACATGTNSIGEAFHCIKDGYADAIIAGGAEAVVAPLTIAGFQNMKALSTNDDPKHASRPFDKNRDGFIMGEGAGMLILEEYEHAVARGAKIYAELSGYGNTCDAHHITAPDPNGAGLARAIKIAFEEANVADDAGLCAAGGNLRRERRAGRAAKGLEPGHAGEPRRVSGTAAPVYRRRQLCGAVLFLSPAFHRYSCHQHLAALARAEPARAAVHVRRGRPVGAE